MSIWWNHIYKAPGEHLLNGSAWQVMVPKLCSEAPGGAKVKSLGCCGIFKVFKGNIATSVGQWVSCQVKIITVTVDSATFLLMTSFLCEGGVWQSLWSKANTNKMSMGQELTGGIPVWGQGWRSCAVLKRHTRSFDAHLWLFKNKTKLPFLRSKSMYYFFHLTIV